jgi:glycosyltransferase involved in cell wall biosynthesis
MRLLEKIDPDVVQVNGWFTFHPSIAATNLNIPVLWYLPDMMVPKPLVYPTRPIIRRYGTKVVTASHAVSEYFFNDPSSVSVIYPPVNITRFNEENTQRKCIDQLRNELKIPKEEPISGTIGNISPNKGHEYLIQSIASIVEHYPNARLVIVGSPLESQDQYYKSLQNQASKLNIEENVIFAGYREDVASLLSIFDVFAFPSLNEASPQAILEAMAMEVPVVATDVGGVPELIVDRESGILVPPKSPSLLSKMILELLEDNSFREQLGRNARKRVESRFSIERCANNFKQAYHSLNDE